MDAGMEPPMRGKLILMRGKCPPHPLFRSWVPWYPPKAETTFEGIMRRAKRMQHGARP